MDAATIGAHASDLLNYFTEVLAEPSVATLIGVDDDIAALERARELATADGRQCIDDIVACAHTVANDDSAPSLRAEAARRGARAAQRLVDATSGQSASDDVLVSARLRIDDDSALVLDSRSADADESSDEETSDDRAFIDDSEQPQPKHSGGGARALDRATEAELEQLESDTDALYERWRRAGDDVTAFVRRARATRDALLRAVRCVHSLVGDCRGNKRAAEPSDFEREQLTGVVGMVRAAAVNVAASLRIVAEHSTTTCADDAVEFDVFADLDAALAHEPASHERRVALARYVRRVERDALDAHDRIEAACAQLCALAEHVRALPEPTSGRQ